MPAGAGVDGEGDGGKRSSGGGTAAAAAAAGTRRPWRVGEPGARGPMPGDKFDCLDYFVSVQVREGF